MKPLKMINKIYNQISENEPNHDLLFQEKYNSITIYVIFSSKNIFICRWVAERLLIKNEKTYIICGVAMKPTIALSRNLCYKWKCDACSKLFCLILLDR